MVTEGPLKADAIVSANAVAVALLGVWSWRGTNPQGGKVALAVWESVALNGRTVLIVFDSDAVTKVEVHEAMARVGAFLAHRGAQVQYADIPSGEMGAKVGVDDFLAAGHSIEDVWATATSELRRPDRDDEEEPEPIDTFDDVADEEGANVLDDVAAYMRRFVAFTSEAQVHAVALWAAPRTRSTRSTAPRGR